MASEADPRDADKTELDLLRRGIAMLSAAHGHRDPFTVKHQQRTADLAAAIAVRLGLRPVRVEVLRLTTIVHDIGKIAIPADILAKPGALSEHEYAIVKTHCAVSHDVLQRLQAPFPVAEIAYQHHERLDGRGYPRGLMGDRIHLGAWSRHGLGHSTMRRSRIDFGCSQSVPPEIRRATFSLDPLAADCVVRPNVLSTDSCHATKRG